MLLDYFLLHGGAQPRALVILLSEAYSRALSAFRRARDRKHKFCGEKEVSVQSGEQRATKTSASLEMHVVIQNY